MGTWAWEALRIAAGICRVGVDTDERTIPNEAGLLGRAVHLEKGCYRGQETVARVHTLGRPPAGSCCCISTAPSTTSRRTAPT